MGISGTSRHVGDALGDRGNALNFIRLCLASMVVAGHAPTLGGIEAAAWVDRLSSVAVDGFFAISGYLIIASRSRLDMPTFVLRRCARILPGFWTCLVVTAFALAPVSTIGDNSWSLRDAVDYVAHNAGLTQRQWGIGSTLADVPYAGVWNGSLWTLEHEFLAYLLAGSLLAVPLVRRAPLGALVPLVLATAVGQIAVPSGVLHDFARLGGFFVAGMVMWVLRDRTPVSWALTLGCGGGMVATFLATDQHWFDAFTPIPMALALLGLGALLPVRIGVENDLSYGVYVYAFPVQQILATLGAQAVGIPGLSVLALALTLPLAWLSWTYVERPALRWVNPRRPSPVVTPNPFGLCQLVDE